MVPFRLTSAPAGASRRGIDPSDAVWGLMPVAKYAEVLERTLERDWIPRFAKLDVDAKAAWSRSA